MPSAAGYVRDYDQESKTAKRRGEHKDNASRKRASRKKSCGPGMEVDHKDGNPQNNSPSNLRCRPVSANRSLKRTGNAAKYDTSKVRKNSTQNGSAYK